MYCETSHFFLEYSYLVYFAELNKSLFRKYIGEEAIRSFEPGNHSYVVLSFIGFSLIPKFMTLNAHLAPETVTFEN